MTTLTKSIHFQIAHAVSRVTDACSMQDKKRTEVLQSLFRGEWTFGCAPCAVYPDSLAAVGSSMLHLIE
jgi:hypothetical protein